MRKIIVFCFMAVIMGLLDSVVLADLAGKSALLPFQDVTILGVSRMDDYIVLTDTTVARLGLSRNAKRKGVIIANLDTTYAIYRATYAVTATQLNSYKTHSSTNPAVGLKRIGPSSEWTDSLETYIGNLYVIGESTASRVEITEKW